MSREKVNSGMLGGDQTEDQINKRDEADLLVDVLASISGCESSWREIENPFQRICCETHSTAKTPQL